MKIAIDSRFIGKSGIGTYIENIVDEFECAIREGEELDYEDIEDAAENLIESIPYAGFGG